MHWRLESQAEFAAPLSVNELVHIEQSLRTIVQQEDIDERECWLIGNTENRAFAQSVVERTGTDYVANEAKEQAISEAALVQNLCERCLEQANLAHESAALGIAHRVELTLVLQPGQPEPGYRV